MVFPAEEGETLRIQIKVAKLQGGKKIPAKKGFAPVDRRVPFEEQILRHGPPKTLQRRAELVTALAKVHFELSRLLVEIPDAIDFRRHQLAQKSHRLGGESRRTQAGRVELLAGAAENLDVASRNHIHSVSCRRCQSIRHPRAIHLKERTYPKGQFTERASRGRLEVMLSSKSAPLFLHFCWLSVCRAKPSSSTCPPETRWISTRPSPKSS